MTPVRKHKVAQCLAYPFQSKARCNVCGFQIGRWFDRVQSVTFAYGYPSPMFLISLNCRHGNHQSLYLFRYSDCRYLGPLSTDDEVSL